MNKYVRYLIFLGLMSVSSFLHPKMLFSEESKSDQIPRGSEIRLVLQSNQLRNGIFHDALVIDVIFPSAKENPPIPKVTQVKFWGLKLVNVEGGLNFLNDRVLHCLVVEPHDQFLTVDCKAAPGLGSEYYKRLTQRWLDLFVWLPELGLAESFCAEGRRTAVVFYEEVGIGYGCKDAVQPFRPIGVSDEGFPVEPW